MFPMSVLNIFFSWHAWSFPQNPSRGLDVSRGVNYKGRGYHPFSCVQELIKTWCKRMQKRMALGMNGLLEIPVLIRFDRN